MIINTSYYIILVFYRKTKFLFNKENRDAFLKKY